MKPRKGTKAACIKQYFDLCREGADYLEKVTEYSDYLKYDFRKSYHYRWFDTALEAANKYPLREFKYHLAMLEKEVARLKEFVTKNKEMVQNVPL